MNSAFIALVSLLALVPLVSGHWEHGYVVQEKIDLNRKICDLFGAHLEKCVSLAGGHNDSAKTIIERLKVLEFTDKELHEDRLVFLDVDAVVAGYESAGVEAPLRREPQTIDRSVFKLPLRQLSNKEAKPLNDFLDVLALAYRHLLKKDFKEEKEIVLRPLAQLKKHDELTDRYSITVDESFSLVVGVQAVGRESGRVNEVASLKIRIDL